MNKEDLIIKWLDNDLSPEELRELEAMEDFESYRMILEEASGFKPPAIPDVTEGLRDVRVRLKEKKAPVTLLKTLRPVLRIAAAVILVLAGYLYISGQGKVKVTTEVAEHHEFVLPDNSIVSLNSHSEIRFNKRKWNESRTLKLKGEAFFDVQKGAAFRVETDGGNVEVLGTEFNVLNRGDLFYVSCYEGSVKVEVQDMEYILHPGESVQVVNGKIKDLAVEGANPAWLSGQSSFESTPLKNVFKEIEAQYGVVILHGNTDLSQLYTGGFTHDNLEQALRSVCQPFGLRYTVTNNKVKIFTIEE